MDPITKYACGDCGELYEDDHEAHFCCAPTPKEVLICKHCLMHYDEDEEHLAEDCCTDLEPDEPPRPDPAELEAAGQLRIAI